MRAPTLNIFLKACLLQHIIRWRLTWNNRNTKYPSPVPDNPKFKSPWDTASLIPDGAVITTAGMGGNMRPSILYWAIREVYEATGHPKGCTVVNTGGQGGRGLAPGTLEEIGQAGLTTRLIAGHVETYKAHLNLAQQGLMEMQIIPQGQLMFLIEAQIRGEDSILTKTGIGTFVDPRVGPGSRILDPKAEQLVEVAGEMLRYHLPKVTATVFNAPAADCEGNLYVKNAALIAESREIALAVHKNNGVVLCTVGKLVEKGYDEIFLPADKITAIAYYPGTEQTGSIPHRKYWSFLTTNSKLSVEGGIQRTRFINQILKMTPKRTKIDNAVGRLAGSIFSKYGHKNMYVNVGIGLPEEVSRLIYEGGLLEDITFITESGAWGGVPTPGVFFGAEVNPKKLISALETFRRCYEILDVAVLGTLQADSQGNVNVSKRGEGPMNYVGPGGFIDFSTAAKIVIFVGAFMAKAEFAIVKDKIKILKTGIPKYVDKVDEITFSGAEAMKRGQKVFYVSTVGVFHLTKRGMELICVMPGIDIEKDIIANTPMKVILPEDGKVEVVETCIINGDGYKLQLKDRPEAQ